MHPHFTWLGIGLLVFTTACTALTEPDEILIIKDVPKPVVEEAEPAPEPAAAVQQPGAVAMPGGPDNPGGSPRPKKAGTG